MLKPNKKNHSALWLTVRLRADIVWGSSRKTLVLRKENQQGGKLSHFQIHKSENNNKNLEFVNLEFRKSTQFPTEIQKFQKNSIWNS